jgi:hypothetical protein
MLLPYGNCEVELLDESTYTRRSVDNVRAYDREYLLGDMQELNASRHGVILRESEEVRASCIVFAGGGLTCIHEHSGLIVGDCLYIAIGDTICSLTLPSLNLNWHRNVDTATCFGVYYLPKQACLISHGECEIARLTLSGDVVWKSGGGDILTGQFRVFPEHIEAIDYNEAVYHINISNGSSQMVSEGIYKDLPRP